jgi:hypothetical protein
MNGNETTPKPAEQLPPIQGPYIVDLGKASNRQIKALKRGEGKLQDEVEDAIYKVVAELKELDKGKPIVPIVLIYRKKRRRGSSGGLLPFPLSPLNLLR